MVVVTETCIPFKRTRATTTTLDTTTSYLRATAGVSASRWPLSPISVQRIVARSHNLSTRLLAAIYGMISVISTATPSSTTTSRSPLQEESRTTTAVSSSAALLAMSARMRTMRPRMIGLPTCAPQTDWLISGLIYVILTLAPSVLWNSRREPWELKSRGLGSAGREPCTTYRAILCYSIVYTRATLRASRIFEASIMHRRIYKHDAPTMLSSTDHNLRNVFTTSSQLIHLCNFRQTHCFSSTPPYHLSN